MTYKPWLLCLMLMLVTALTSSGQQLGTLPVKPTPIDTGTYVIITSNQSGIYYTYKVKAGKLAAFLRDSALVVPGGSNGNIQTKSGTAFTGSNDLNYSGTIFNVGFSGNNFLLMDVSGNASFLRNNKFDIKDVSNATHFRVDPTNGMYALGGTAAKIICNQVAGRDTVEGIIVARDLAGGGNGVVGVDNDGRLSLNTSTMNNTLASGKLYVGNVSNVATAQTPSGDISMTNAGVFSIVSNVNLPGNPTTTTQSALDNSTKIATTAFTRGEITAERSSSVTLTNHRITPRVNVAASHTTSLTMDSDNYDGYEITAQSGALLFNAPSGTPTRSQQLFLSIKGNATPAALTWNSIFRAGSTVALPTTTTSNKAMYIQFLYNLTSTKWDCVGVSDGH